MKNYLFVILLFFVITASNQSYAQYGNRNGYGNGYGNNMGGNSMANDDRNSKSEAQIEKEKTEYLNKSIEKLKADLKLDELQLIVIKREVETNSNTINKILKSEISDEDKTKEIEATSEQTNRNIMSYLNPEQKKKYQGYIDTKKEQLDKYKAKKSRN